MINLCRFCRRVGTSGDGPGAPCRACIEVAVAVATDGRHAVGSRVAASARRSPRAAVPEPLTVTERMLVRGALCGLRGRASDVALAGSLPILAVELALRSLARRRPTRPQVVGAPAG